jgi:hypothetical protein
MSSSSQESYVVYVPVTIKLPQAEESPKHYLKDATTQTETIRASASKTNSAASTIDFAPQRARGKPKYGPLKYRCIPAGYETDSEDDPFTPPIVTSSTSRWYLYVVLKTLIETLDFHDGHILMPQKILPQDEKLASTILRQCDQFSWMMMASYTICELRNVVAYRHKNSFLFFHLYIYLYIYFFVHL